MLRAIDHGSKAEQPSLRSEACGWFQSRLSP
jgi:hypothetical protein